MKFLKWVCWYITEFAKFTGQPRICHVKESVSAARFMRRWEDMTCKQREAWYLSGEGRILKI